MAEGAGVWIRERGRGWQVRCRAERGGAFATETFTSRDAAEARAAECRALMVTEAAKRVRAEAAAAAARRTRARIGFVYFVEAQPSGAIKIGHAADWRRRIDGLRTGNHEHLRLLCAIHGSIENEQALHWDFRQYRLRGEWFSPGPLLVAYLRSVMESGLNVGGPPDAD